MTKVMYPLPLQPTLRGRVERAVAREFGWCLRCGRPWRFVDPHKTEYTRELPTPPRDRAEAATVAGIRWAIFALCDGCWSGLGDPQARLHYYRVLWESWGTRDDDQWAAIRTAVLNGR